jgi:hypothetical protein
VPRAADIVEDGLWSIEMLRTELKVSRRSIERAIEAKHMKPCAYTISGRRARFNLTQVREYRWLAKEGRSRGSHYVMGYITSTGTMKKRVVLRDSALTWLKKKSLKHNPDLLRSLQVAEKYLDLDAMLGI